jgi:cyanate permease
LGVLIAKNLDSGWRHQILLLEILELLAFAVFWVMQTAEHWAGGVPTGDERAERAAAA